MTIEKLISDLTIAVNGLTSAIAQQGIAANLGVSNVPQIPVSVNPAPVAAPQQAPVGQAQMPVLPTFAVPPTPAAAAPVQGAPFTDGQGLIQYVMAAYKEMGATKGAGIQGVLTQLGYQNINDVKPEHYGALYQGVEALKRG